jgi:hypothetical protein
LFSYSFQPYMNHIASLKAGSIISYDFLYAWLALGYSLEHKDSISRRVASHNAQVIVQIGHIQHIHGTQSLPMIGSHVCNSILHSTRLH